VIWPNCNFQTDYDEIELKNSYVVISVTLSLSRHQLTSQVFPFGLLPIKIFGYTNDLWSLFCFGGGTIVLWENQ